jgi:hypothetical protein
MSDAPIAELASYQEALVEILLLDLAPAEQHRRLLEDPRARPFFAYVQSIELRCLEVTSALMKRWALRR